jgi:hypothetical protein
MASNLRPPVDWSLVDQFGADPTSSEFDLLVAPYTVDEAEMRDMVCSMRWGHYVYALCAGKYIFYIGKGTGGRALHHRADARAGEISDKAEMIRRLGPALRYCVLLSGIDDDFVVLMESKLIEDNWELLVNARRESPETVCASVLRRNVIEEAQFMMAASARFANVAEDLQRYAVARQRQADKIRSDNWREAIAA